MFLTPKFDVEVQLSGLDGNAGSIVGRTAEALRRAGASREELAEFRAECYSGDYDHLLQTVMTWVEVF